MGYDVDIRWTTHGVPHIRAADWASLGFGQGFACARDHFVTIADQVTKVRSERSRFLGAGPADANLHSDLAYLALGVRERAARMAEQQPAEVQALVQGYADGLSAWLDETGRDALPEWCRDAAWIRPIAPEDLYAFYVDLAIMGSGRNLVSYIGSARPPGADDDGARPGPAPIDPGLGSNGWALGRDATSTGRGMVMANPHFPWFGEGRFWESHLTIPGELEVYGVSLIGTPLVSIGFNRHVAWTHTFSRGHRFTVYKLDLVPGDPTRYRYGDEERSCTARELTVPVLHDDGTVTDVHRTLWSSHYGPMLDLPFIGWSDAMAFTYRDANLDNDRFLQQVLANDRATSVADFRDALAAHQGMPWVNTIAADETGACLYIDSSTTPKLTAEADESFETAVDADPITGLLHTMRVALLDGSDPRFEWVEDPSAIEPGLLAFDELPQLERTDHVFNANDPYWLPHAMEQLPRHPALCGLYRRTVSPRTRMNALLVAGTGSVAPSGPDGRFTPQDLEDAVLGNHSLLAEMLVDDVVPRLQAAAAGDAPDAERLAEAARIISAWDRRYDLDSVGAVLFREWLASFPQEALQDAGPLFATGFDPEHPVATPHTLAPAPAEGPDPVVTAMRAALGALDLAGLAPDVALGDAQYIDRAGRRIPLHGANEIEGIANVVAPIGALATSDLEPRTPGNPPVPGRTERTGLHEGGYPVTYGASWLMISWFDDEGVHGRGLLAYGQSGDPASPHHVDQVEAFSRKELRPLLLDDAAIDADTTQHRHLTTP